LFSIKFIYFKLKEDEVQDILKFLSSNDYHRYDSTALERLKLAAEDETFALEFVKQNGLQYLLKLFTNEEKSNKLVDLFSLLFICSFSLNLVMKILHRIYFVHFII
jgi:hypothetical protein